MQKDDEVMGAFAKLGASQIVPDSIKNCLNRFTCSLYGVRGKCQDVNNARHMLFLNKIPQRKTKKILSKLKSFDPATLPPCRSTLEQKIYRVNFVTHILINSHKAHISEWDPLNNGWIKEERTGNLIPNWFEGERVPDDLFHEETEIEDNDSENDDLSDIEGSDICSSSDSDDSDSN